MKKIGIIIVYCITCKFGLAQTLSGTVTGHGKPLQGVTISVRSAHKTLLTDSAGFFSLPVSGKTVLRFSFTGYTEKDTAVDITGPATLSINLEPVEEELEDVVIVSSSRTNSRIEDLPTRVEVLGMEEVHEENGIKPGNIASLLGDIAGIQIQQTSAATGNADMRIQGLPGKYTQLLRDGMPLFGGYSGSFSILQIPPLDLQQIELVKGASSTLYGGGAIAGMVNLISKKPKTGNPEKSFTLNHSSLRESNANLFFSGRNERAGYTLFAGGTLQDPVDVNKDGFSDVPSVKNVFVHPRIFLYGGRSSTVVLGYTLGFEDRNGGDMLAIDRKANDQHPFFIRNRSWRNTADITWEKSLAGSAQLTVKGSGSFFNRDISTHVFGMKGRQFTWYTEAAYSRKTERHSWVAGVNFNGDRFTKQFPDSSLLPDERNNVVGFFIQDDWKLHDKLTVQGGLRTDVHNRYGSFVLPRLSVMYRISGALTARVGGGWGYKTPTLFNSEIDERDYRFLAGYLPGTQAERAFGVNSDLNYHTRLSNWKLTVNQAFFYNTVSHPLLLTQPAPPALQYVNMNGSLQTTGSETYVQAAYDELELYLGYVYTHARRNYQPANPNLPLIARHKFATVIAYAFSSRLRAGIESSYTGRQYLDDGSTTQPYLFTAAMVRYAVGKMAFVLNCENIFDYRQNKHHQVVFPPYTNPSFPEIWAPLDGRVANLSMYVKF
ncbi:TonB-dependent receptor [Sediminibacterium soli]|uniref:TonB-dependent receptor n=1 Tax=Sediminibacterium soli TaxID=2698829 RepID=UPI00137B147B|nr:TonB-dependent receptor [Sediminibacterium soli]NCI47981.1 TonB-dependent receptor [Sediminibacterium soli]